FFFFQAEDGIRDGHVTGVQTCALPILDAEVLEMTNAETAEFTKLAETTYRDVNFALANQLALYASGRHVNAQEAFTAANTQPFSDRKSTRLNSSHVAISYAVFCLKKKR